MSSGIRIAVKEVVLGIGKKQEQQALALLREIKILSELDHPNIIKYLGTEYSENTMRIFLELATEGSLKDALTAFGVYMPCMLLHGLDGCCFFSNDYYYFFDNK